MLTPGLEGGDGDGDLSRNRIYGHTIHTNLLCGKSDRRYNHQPAYPEKRRAPESQYYRTSRGIESGFLQVEEGLPGSGKAQEWDRVWKTYEGLGVGDHP